MSKLIQVIHYPDSNSVEATWAIQTIKPAVGIEGDEDYQAEKIDNIITRCHSYADVQMDMFRSDVAEFGGDISEHEEMIALVEANIKPVVPAPVIIPSVVTMRQARLALLQEGLLSDVTSAISAITDETSRQAAQIEWEYATIVDRNSTFTQQLVTALGLTNEQVDSLFLQASTL